jgi:uncharacterized membrane protein YesL
VEKGMELMEQQGWKSGLVRFSEWFMRLAYMNLLWMGFTLLGLVLFGFVPATVALFAMIRKWMMGKLDTSIFKGFWAFYRKEFLKANSVGLIFLIIGYILYIDIMVLQFNNSMVQQILQFLIYIIALFYVMALVLFFPVYVQFELKWYQYIKLSFLLALSSPFRAIWMIVIGYGIFFLMTIIPGLIPFFLGSVTAYLWLMIALPLFFKLEQQGEREEA